MMMMMVVVMMMVMLDNDGRICVVHHSIVSILGGKLVMNSSSLLTCTSTHNPVEQHTLRFYFDGDDLTEVIMMQMVLRMIVVMVCKGDGVCDNDNGDNYDEDDAVGL